MSRQLETKIEIKAPADVVWKALTDAEEISRWLAPNVKVEPGVGGSIWMSYGPGMEGAMQIEIWEPGRHLRTIDERSKPYSCAGSGESDPAGESVMYKIAVDYLLETAEGGTVLRLIHSGFGPTAEWDNEFESTKRGWPVLLRILKHGLERHRGEGCRQVQTFVTTSQPAEEAWKRLMSAQGVLFNGAAVADGPGQRYAFRTPAGDVLVGVAEEITPLSFSGTAENLNDGIVALMCEPNAAGGAMVWVQFSLYGMDPAQASEIEKSWKGLLEQLYA